LKEPGWNAAVYRPWIQHLLHTFPIGKLAFGSGWPLSMPHATWKESLACFTQALGPQSLEHRSCLFGENAADYFRVSVATVGYTEESPE
jgi:predicted TIM-barrel fold metal-dependent hydrolase